jgi:gliding motility-associated-like protein
VNDYFFPRQFLSSGVIAFKMAVYNRWGQKIYETDNINGRGWDGKFNSKDQPEGVYVYIIDVTMKNYRQEHYTGNVTLLR